MNPLPALTYPAKRVWRWLFRPPQLLWLAAIVVILALLVMLSANSGLAWRFWSAPSLAAAEAWVAFLGVLATVIAIGAAYSELRIVMPRQELHVRREVTFMEDYGFAVSRVKFCNAPSGAVINSYRLEVWLENSRGLPDGVHGNPAWDSGGDTNWTRLYSGEPGFSDHHWVLQKNEPFFPDTVVWAPYVRLRTSPGRWRARWQTDRNSAREVLVFDVPTEAQ